MTQGTTPAPALLAQQRLREIEARANAATPEPWVIIPARPYDGDDDDQAGSFVYPGGIEGGDGNPVCMFGDPAGSGTMFENEHDHELIAHARTDIPALLSHAAAQAQEVERLAEALNAINTIRNSIVACQKVNFSEHVYPLVAALDEAGIEGMPYPEAVQYFGTMLERTNAAEARAAALEQRVRAAQPIIEAARCIQHWHDAMADNSGMVVSAEHVRALWQALDDYDASRAPSKGAEPGGAQGNGNWLAETMREARSVVDGWSPEKRDAMKREVAAGLPAQPEGGERDR